MKTNLDKVHDIIRMGGKDEDGNNIYNYKGYANESGGRFYITVNIGEGNGNMGAKRNFILRARKNYTDLYKIKLTQDMQIHHKNRETLDDRPSNLEVMAGNIHTSFHNNILKKEDFRTKFYSMSIEERILMVKRWNREYESKISDISVHCCGERIGWKDSDVA